MFNATEIISWYEPSPLRFSQTIQTKSKPFECLWKKHFCVITRWPCLTHWGRVTHISVSNTTIIGSDNGLSPGRRQAIIWTNAGILLIGPLGTNFSEILAKIITSPFKKMYLKVSSVKWRPFCLGLNVLKHGRPNFIQQSYQLSASTLCFLQVFLVEFAPQGGVDLGHHWSGVFDIHHGCMVLGLWEVSHEAQDCDPNRKCCLQERITWLIDNWWCFCRNILTHLKYQQ